MKYLLNLGTGALDDVETPKLGEKYFASAETDDIIRQINEQHGPGTLFPASEAPQPENPYKDFDDRNPAANGGMMRQNYAAGPLVLPPAMLYGAGVALGIGSQIKGENVLEQSRILKEHISENSDDPKVQALLMSLGIVTQDVKDNVSESVKETGLGLDIGPDADEIEETKPIILSTPIESYEGSFKDQGLTIPEPEKQLPNTGGRIDVPISEGMDIVKTGPIIFDRKETDINDLKNKKGKNTLIDILDQQQKTIPKFDKLDKKSQEKFIKSQEKKITSLPQNQAYTEPALSKDYVNVLKNYIETYHDGNITVAATELGFDKQKKRTLNARLSKIGFEGKGVSAEATLDIADGELRYVDAIKQIKDNPAIYKSNIKKLIKEKNLSNKDYVSTIDLANIFNIDGLTVLERTQLLKRLNKLDIRRKKGTQGSLGVKYHLGDALSKLTDYAKTKQAAPGEAVDAVKTRRSREFDVPLNNAVSATKKILRDRATNSDIVLPGESLAKDKGHAASLDVMAKFPEYFTKNSNTTNFQSFINQDPTINQDFLMSKGYHKIESAIFQRLKDKKINKDEANNELKENWDYIQRLIKIRMKTMPFLRDQGNVVPLLQLDKNSVVQADMSTVDSYFIYGNIDKINPKAKTFSSLSKKQQSQYLSNVKEQYIEGAVKFLTNLKDDKTGERIYSKQEIDNYEEMLSAPLDKDSRRKYNFATGGVIPDQEIMNYANGGRINYENGSPRGPNEPEGDDFLNELEFKFNNIDSVKIDDTPTTFDNSKSKIAQFNDLLDYKNIPYAADLGVRTLSRIGEFGARVLPATGNLISDILQKPMFKTPSSYERTENYANMVDDTEVPSETQQGAKFVGGPIFKNFLKNLTPTSTEKLVGLDTLMNEEKKKMIARGDSSLMVKVGETAALGGELVAPIFPGLKLIKAFGKARNINKSKAETTKLIEQEIDTLAKAEGMDRREFLQVSGAVGTVALAKLLGISSELPKVAKVAEKVVSTGPTTPAYFLNLVAKIKNLGTDITQTGALVERQTVIKYKDYEMTTDTATGRVEVIRLKVADDADNAGYYGGPLTEETYMSFSPGETIIGKNGQPIKTLEEYDEGTAFIRSDRANAGEIVDESFDISEDVIKDGTKFEDNLSDFGE